MEADSNSINCSGSKNEIFQTNQQIECHKCLLMSSQSTAGQTPSPQPDPLIIM